LKKDVYIAIVSHNHQDLIIDAFANFPKEIGNYNLHLSTIDNVNSKELKNFADDEKIFYYTDGKIRGYGANLNKLYDLLSPKDEDIFIVCNPDIILDAKELNKILDKSIEENADIYGAKVYTRRDFSKVSSSNRSFPCVFDFFASIVLKKRVYMHDPEVYANPDWISGAFMVIKSSSYRELKGFDEKYFLYCEDIDICYRAKKSGMKIVYNPAFYVVHESQLASRTIFSKTFLMHLKSIIRYLVTHRITCVLGKGGNYAK